MRRGREEKERGGERESKGGREGERVEREGIEGGNMRWRSEGLGREVGKEVERVLLLCLGYIQIYLHVSIPLKSPSLHTSDMANIVALLLINMFIFAIIGLSIFGDSCPQHFGTLGSSEIMTRGILSCTD